MMLNRSRETDFWRFCLVAVLIGVAVMATFTSEARADQAETIVIGRTAGVTGQVAAAIKEQTEAVNAYFSWVNRNGGVHGRKIVLKTMDDAFDPKKAGENGRVMIEQDKVFALFLTRGTPHTEAVLKYAQPAGVPIIAPSTGAELFHSPVNRLIFNVRAKYQDEVVAAVRHLHTSGTTRIAMLHVNDSFGRDCLAGFQRGMGMLGIRPVKVVQFDRAKNDAASKAPELIEADPNAVIVIGSASAVISFVKEMRAKGSTAQFVTLSNNATNAFIKDVGQEGQGMLMTQVTPAADSMKTLLGREFQKIVQPGGATPSYSAMEAYSAAKVLVEGLKRAGKNPTRDRFISAMEGLRDYDLGGMAVDYSSMDRTGSTFVEVTMIGKGRFVR
jgi:branched-chain amino acid transport system substrate-binding protein